MTAKEYIPTEVVSKLSERGMSEHEIIIELRKRGFSATQIDRALKQAVKKAIGKKSKLPEKPLVTRHPTGKIPPSPAIRASPNAIPKARLGIPSEKIEIPESLKPISLPFGKGPEKPVKLPEGPVGVPSPPKHVGRPIEFKEKPKDLSITIEELVEGVVAEENRNMDRKIRALKKQLTASNNKITSVEKEIEIIKNSLSERGNNLTKALGDINTSIDKIESHLNALEIAFKGFANKKRK